MLNLYKILMLTALMGGFIQAIDASTSSREEIRNQNKAYFQKMGITLLDGEVKIVKANILMNQAQDDYYSSQIQSFLVMHQEQEKNGFVKEPEPRAKELLDFKQTAKYQYKKYFRELSPSSTHLRHVISDLKMAYTFVGVPEYEMSKNIGVAPYGAYKQASVALIEALA